MTKQKILNYGATLNDSKTKYRSLEEALEYQSGFHDAVDALYPLIEMYSFLLNQSESLLRPDRPLHDNLDPTFYQTLSFEGDLELRHQIVKARVVKEELEKKLV